MRPFPVDVPVERGSVSAMAVTTGSRITVVDRPYVYRGTGEDQFLETPPKTKPKTKRRKPKPRPKPKPKTDWVAVRAAVIEARREFLERQREPEPEPAKPKVIRSSPGWTPPTGADFGGWLDE